MNYIQLIILIVFIILTFFAIFERLNQNKVASKKIKLIRKIGRIFGWIVFIVIIVSFFMAYFEVKEFLHQGMKQSRVYHDASQYSYTQLYGESKGSTDGNILAKLGVFMTMNTEIIQKIY